MLGFCPAEAWLCLQASPLPPSGTQPCELHPAGLSPPRDTTAGQTLAPRGTSPKGRERESPPHLCHPGKWTEPGLAMAGLGRGRLCRKPHLETLICLSFLQIHTGSLPGTLILINRLTPKQTPSSLCKVPTGRVEAAGREGRVGAHSESPRPQAPRPEVQAGLRPWHGARCPRPGPSSAPQSGPCRGEPASTPFPVGRPREPSRGRLPAWKVAGHPSPVCRRAAITDRKQRGRSREPRPARLATPLRSL